MSGLIKLNFHGDELEGVRDDGGFLSLRKACDNLGIDADSQRQKLAGKAWACTAMITVQLPGDRQRREVFMIHRKSVPMWLATIDPERVAEHVRPKLELYQREVADVLDKWFDGAPKETRQSLAGVRIRLLVHSELARVVSAIPGVHADSVAAVQIDAIGREFDVNTEQYRLAMPSRNEGPGKLNPTQLGALVKISAREANRRLLAAGLQSKNEAGDWMLTEVGTKHGEAQPFFRNGHKGFDLRWKPETADVIKDATLALAGKAE